MLISKINKKQKALQYQKNKGIIPECPDERLKYVTAACGKCYECRKQKARAWQVRISEETRQNPNALFVTLTITDEWYLAIFVIDEEINICDFIYSQTVRIQLFGSKRFGFLCGAIVTGNQIGRASCRERG